MIAGLFCEGGLIAGGIGVREGRQTCFFTVSVERSLLTPRHEWRRMHKAVQLFGLRLVYNKGLDFRRPSPMRSHDMTRCWQIVWKVRQKEFWTIQKPSSCLKKVNLNKEKPFAFDYKNIPPIIEQGQIAWEQNISLTIDPVIDQWFNGISKEAVGQDQARQAPIFSLDKASSEVIKETGIDAGTIP